MLINNKICLRFATNYLLPDHILSYLVENRKFINFMLLCFFLIQFFSLRMVTVILRYEYIDLIFIVCSLLL